MAEPTRIELQEAEVIIAVFEFKEFGPSLTQAPGFYWAILLDEDGRHITPHEVPAHLMMGPSGTKEVAFLKAQEFLDECGMDLREAA